MHRIFYIFLFLVSSIAWTQDQWTWIEIDTLPLASSNNAVSEAQVGLKKYVYSFGGIGDSLTISSVHQKVFKYSINNDQWQEVSEIPDTLGKIGSSASFVNNRIYLIGGKYLLADSTEAISNKVHVYYPKTDEFQDGVSSIPLPVSDHVQAIWRDSLIYIISGETDLGATPQVQIYNPYEDTWRVGTPLPDEEEFVRKGASGYILNDTIYYYGGVFDTLNPSNSNQLIKGVINPYDPTDITWTSLNINLGATIYRGASSGFGNYLFWVGGSGQYYNYSPYDTITNTIIQSNRRTMLIDLHENSQVNNFNALNNAYDLRGIANLGGGNWIIAGGLEKNGKATNKSFLLHNPILSSIEKLITPPHFEVIMKEDHFLINTENIGEIMVYNLAGQLLYKSQKNLSDLKIDKYLLQHGFLLFVYDDNINIPLSIKKVNP